jgi:hypothetical protein
MSWLDQLTPTNLLEEKAKFFADPTYNPQFTYPETNEEPVEADKWGYPQQPYLDLAKAILEKTFFGRNEADLLMMEGVRLSQDEVTKRCTTFLEMHGLEKRYEIIWSPTFVSRATITDDALKLRSNSVFHQEGLLGMLYHEIGTHALRRINYEHQPWFKKKKKFGVNTSYLRTEEGMATLHTQVPHSFKSAYSTAVRYLAVEYARDHTFAELWKFVGRYIQDPETCWMITFRQKRGVTDTSKPAVFTKDLVYFEGAVQMWHWLEQHNFDPTLLYYGKIAWEDLGIAKELNPNFEPLLPSFYRIDPAKYAKDIHEIGIINQFDQIKIDTLK